VATTVRDASRRLVAAVAVAAAALVVTPAAAAHGGGGDLGFRSEVTRVTPATTDLTVSVRDHDDRLELRNETGRTVVVLGYENEPYLVFRDGRVLRNTRSPATYLNDERYGDVSLPAVADAKAAPEWEEVAEKEEYEWHDHRIHWMSRTLPPKVAADEGSRHHVFDWTVRGRLGGERLAIAGSLEYEPPPSGNPTLLVGVIVAVAVGGGFAVLLRRRRGRST
jgi:hypothetical protein